MSATSENGPDRSILPLPEPENPPITEIDARKATPPPRFELKHARRDVRTEHGAPRDAPEPVAAGMRWIPGGTFAMGSENFYPEERPVRRVSVDGFWMDETPGHRRPSSAGSCARRGYATLAERPLDASRLSRRGSRAAGAGLARVPQDAQARST